MTVTKVELKQHRWIAFAGIIVEFEGPEDSEAALADRARKVAFDRFQWGKAVSMFEIGVTDIQLDPRAVSE